jgi:RimJ/RimL family protein N-acetyltransferase
MKIKELDIHSAKLIALVEVRSSQTSLISTSSVILSQFKQNDTVNRLFGFFIDDEIVGYCILNEFDQHNHSFIWQLVIDYRHQRKGYGTQGIKEIIEILLREKPNRIITTVVKENNIKSLRLFERLNFIEISSTSHKIRLEYKHR